MSQAWTERRKIWNGLSEEARAYYRRYMLNQLQGLAYLVMFEWTTTILSALIIYLAHIYYLLFGPAIMFVLAVGGTYSWREARREFMNITGEKP